MEKILTLGKIENNFISALGFEFIQLPQFTNDDDRHDFVVRTLKPKEFDKLVIVTDSEDGYDELVLGFHIRLTIDLHQKRLAPLFFISPDSLAVVLRNAGVWGRILTTKGCKLGQLNVEAVRAGLEFPALPSAEIGSFLSLIQLRPDEIAGRHSLANQWGAYSLDKAAGTHALQNNLSLTKARKQLYFKYVEAINYAPEKLSQPISIISESSKPKSNPIDATGKKILLIDDEADKGWRDVLSVLFKKSNQSLDFQVIDRKITGWNALSEDEKKLILESNFDLFLIDLRLTGSEEEDTAKPEDFSGTDVMRKIKQHNAGNQVIMFTASNKAWNLKALLDFGADGYYIKESPEYNFPEKFSVENFEVFRKEVDKCLEKDYLREAHVLIESVKRLLKLLKGSKLIKSDVIATTFLDQGFNALYQATSYKKEFYFNMFAMFRYE